MSEKAVTEEGNQKGKALTHRDITSDIIGTNLKRIRQTRNLSLDEVSSMSSVSKSMLSEIERNKKPYHFYPVWEM